jgi:homoserine kinase
MGLEAVMVVPSEPVQTEAARAALPTTVPLVDAVFNVAHASTLILGLVRDYPDLIAAGLRDRLHQPARAGLYPRSAQLLERASELGALGATISGAGPSVLFWSRLEQTGLVLSALKQETSGWAHVKRVTFESRGADVREL